MGVVGWLRDKLGLTEADRSVAKSRRLAAELHETASETTRTIREGRIRLERKTQDWTFLYESRMRDDAG